MPVIAMLIQAGLPWLANALMGPEGIATAAANKIAEHIGIPTGAAGRVVEDVKTVLSGFKPEQFADLKKVENEFKLEMTKAGYLHEEQLATIDLNQITVVNKTIQIELENSDKEEWYQKAWRPANGFAVAAGAFAGVIAVCYLGYVAIKTKDPSALNMIPALSLAIAGILAVPGAAVGIAAWHRGVQQRIEAQGDANGATNSSK